MTRRSKKGMTLIEIIIAIMILASTIFFLFEILLTSYTYTNKMKLMTKLTKLTQAKIEDVLYLNAATDTLWTKFTGEPEFEYMMSTLSVPVDPLFPQYKVTKVTVETKGPVGRVNIPEYHFALTTYLLDETQSVTATDDPGWGGGLRLPAPAGGPGRASP